MDIDRRIVESDAPLTTISFERSFTLLNESERLLPEAVDAYQRAPNQYRVIFMDCQMPIMDGYQAATRIRALEKEQNRERQLIVAVSPHALKEERKRSLECGMDDHLAKPIKNSDLRNLLSKHKVIA